MNFAVPADHKVKFKESEDDKYLDFARELKKLWNMKVTIIPLVIVDQGIVTKGLIKGQEDLELFPSLLVLFQERLLPRKTFTKEDFYRGRQEIITTAMLRPTRILSFPSRLGL